MRTLAVLLLVALALVLLYLWFTHKKVPQTPVRMVARLGTPVDEDERQVSQMAPKAATMLALGALAIAMTDRQKVPYGVALVDVDDQPLTELPEGASISFTSSDESVADIREYRNPETDEVDPFTCFVGSGKVGKATITAHASGFVDADGNPVTIPDETLEVTVLNSAPGRLNATVGVPTDE